MRARRTPALFAALAVVLVADVVTAGVRSGGGSAPKVSIRPQGGPTALQLAGGKWLPIPEPPDHMCAPIATPSGDRLYVIEYGWNGCARSAAVYEAVTNSWTQLPPLPARMQSFPSIVWAGNQLVAVTPTGRTFSYRPTTNRWLELGALPELRPRGYGAIDLLWTGEAILANTESADIRKQSGVITYSLDRSGHWAKLATIHANPQAFMNAPLATYHRSVYAWVASSAGYGHQAAGPTRLLQLGADGWSPVRPRVSNPKSQLQLTTTTGGILATGSKCPLPNACTQEVAAASIVRPGSATRATPLKPPLGTPYPYDIAAGATAVVVTYTSGPNSYGDIVHPATSSPGPGTTLIFDVQRDAWLNGPGAPTTSRTEATSYWTAAGIVLLQMQGRGGWLLRPGP